MFKFIIFMIIILIIIYLIKNKVVIKFKSFFKKGFKLKNDKYRLLLRNRQTTALGKTLFVITFLNELKNKNKNLRVITNVKSYADNNKNYVIYNDNFYDIIEKFRSKIYDENYVIFYDEIFTLLEKGKLDKSILSFISQLRKRKLYLITTAQEWLEINVTFRRYVRYQIDCNMFSFPLFNCAFSVNKINDGYSMQWDNLQNEYIAPRIKTIIRKCSLAYAKQYDTFEIIDENKNINPISKARQYRA